MNDGFLNEKELINYIDKKYFNNYSNNIKNFLIFLFDGKINNRW